MAVAGERKENLPVGNLRGRRCRGWAVHPFQHLEPDPMFGTRSRPPKAEVISARLGCLLHWTLDETSRAWIGAAHLSGEPTSGRGAMAELLPIYLSGRLLFGGVNCAYRPNRHSPTPRPATPRASTIPVWVPGRHPECPVRVGAAMPPLTHAPLPAARPFRLGGGLAYTAMLAAAVVLFLAVDRAGSGLAVPTAAVAGPGSSPGAGKSGVLVHVLVTLVAVVTAGQLLGRLCRYVGQPPVIGEVVAGILLGPSLLGRVWPEASAFLLPSHVGPFIGVIAQLGVIVYMFLVGLELNPAVLRERAGRTVAIAHASIAVPFVGGAALGLHLYPRLAGGGVPFTSFALFMGVALSVTAFPVLARILTDRRMHTTALGVTALGAAAAGDVTAWCLLAFAIGVAQAAVGGAVLTLALTAVFVAAMLAVVRPVLGEVLRRYDDAHPTPAVTAAVFVAVLVSALATEAIGIHALFGAFLLGAVVPHDSRLGHAFRRKVEGVVTVLLLPAYFASVGLRTEIGLVSGLWDWLTCGLIIVVATAGKFGGTYTAARFGGLARPEAAGLGVLMNTRGLMELIVLNIGLEMGIISPTLFAMMVLMALTTTVATGPALRLLGVDRPGDAGRGQAERGSGEHG